MENATEAFMMAFGVFTLVIALSISISLLGQVNACSEAILNNIDRENEYIYIENTGMQRQVGIETIIPTIYRAYNENYKIVFYDNNKEPYELYIKDGVSINTIDLENEAWADYKKFLQCLLFGSTTEYANCTFYEEGLYKRLDGQKITEYLGEYYQEDVVETQNSNISDINKTKKRIIVYVVN